MQFINFSLDKLVKKLSDKDFKYFVEEFGFENLWLLKQKDAYPYEYMNSFEKFIEQKFPNKKCFDSSLKDEQLMIMVEKLDGPISAEDYLTRNKIWN